VAVVDSMAKKRTDISVKIQADVYRKVRTVAAWRGVNISDYLSGIVDPVVSRDLAKINKEADKPPQEEHP
jgi:hypothetical protein